MSRTVPSVAVELKVILYGSCSRDPDNDDRFTGDDQRRAEIDLQPQIPVSSMVSMQTKQQWITRLLCSIGNDIKHSRNWRCEFCKKKARETVWTWASWMHLSPPRLQCYVHSICDAARGSCHDTLVAVTNEMGRMTGCPLNVLPQPKLPEGEERFSLAASCACCERQETAQKHQLKQCTRCKVTRYCSVECQQPDWPRHKDFCKTVKEVKWVWSHE
ncbi:hypothetical protein C8J56DRAFT_1169624 [Mycena floridula]|nr:hypothetical protein C8J56DRAFT_1169624 [Mycena floridula]